MHGHGLRLLALNPSLAEAPGRPARGCRRNRDDPRNAGHWKGRAGFKLGREFEPARHIHTVTGIVCPTGAGRPGIIGAADQNPFKLARARAGPGAGGRSPQAPSQAVER